MTRPLRVLQIIDSLALGGAERIVAMLTQGLARSGVDVRVAALRSLAGDSLRDPLERAGIPLLQLDATGFYDVGAWMRLRRYLRHEAIDLVHTHLVYADFLGRTASAAAGIPVVSTLHNVPDGFERQRPDRVWLERITARLLTSRVVCVSQRARTEFEQSWRIPSARLALIPNAIDLDPWLSVPEEPIQKPSDTRPMELPVQVDTVTVLSVGRLDSQKAYDVLLRAARIVVDVRPHVRFVILGRGRHAASLDRLRRELALAEVVSFEGQQDDVPAWLARSDMFVSSSAWEGMPLVVIEAMAAARPVVVTDVGGSREVVGDEECGLVVPPSDPRALAVAIMELVDDSERRLRMGRSARDRARTVFGLDGLIDAHLSLYRDVVAWGAAGHNLVPNVTR